jgi:hypothetical protein
MSSSNVARGFWALILLISVANGVRVLQDPEAVRFFAVAIGALVAVGAVGSCVALILVGLRRFSERERSES